MNELYEELETPEGDRKLYRLAKAKEFTNNNQIKDEQRVVLRDLDRIMGRWKGYFDKLLNGENHRFVSEDGVPNDGLTQGIGSNEAPKHADRTLQHKPLSTIEGQRVALMNLGSLTEIRGDSINSGHSYRWLEKRKLST